MWIKGGQGSPEARLERLAAAVVRSARRPGAGDSSPSSSCSSISSPSSSSYWSTPGDTVGSSISASWLYSSCSIFTQARADIHSSTR
eukprot:m.307458 g.307458  ORF g.307458 m.307458 type:complete len:87 (+) comp55315_c0_seq3:121-381(+)